METLMNTTPETEEERLTRALEYWEKFDPSQQRRKELAIAHIKRRLGVEKASDR